MHIICASFFIHSMRNILCIDNLKFDWSHFIVTFDIHMSTATCEQINRVEEVCKELETRVGETPT